MSTTQPRYRPFALRVPPPSSLKVGLGVGAVALVVLVWFLLTLGETAEARVISPAVLPSPGEVVRSFPTLLERGLVDAIVATLWRVILGFSLAIAVGVPLGFLAGAFRVFDAAAAPLALFGRNVPIAALIPLTVLWFGIDETQKVMFIFIACVPFVFGMASAALSDVHDRYVDTAQTLGASSRQVIFKVLIPLAMPDVYNGLRQLFGLAFGYIMLAELINTESGLGALLISSQRRAITEHIFLILVIIGLLAYGIDRVLLVLQRGFFPYREIKE